MARIWRMRFGVSESRSPGGFRGACGAGFVTSRQGIARCVVRRCAGGGCAAHGCTRRTSRKYDNRPHLRLPRMAVNRSITSVNLDITTHCNRRCADCCCNIGQRPTRHHLWSYFEDAAKWLHGIERIHLTGGEPTAHPQFAEFAPRFRELFGCETLTLGTNGYRVRELESTLHCFDEIYASRYPGNDAEVGWLVANFKVKLFDGEFTPRSRRGSGAVCARGTSETVAYADGKLYGCCVAPGIPGAVGVTPSADWKERAVGLPLPCNDCWFSL